MFRIIKDKILGKQPVKHEKYSLSKSLDKNIQLFQSILNNDDTIIYREFESKSKDSVKFCIIFDKNLAKMTTIDDYVIKAIRQKEFSTDVPPKKRIDLLLKKIIITCDNRRTSDLDEIFGFLFYGNTILLIDGVDEAILICTKEWHQRSITEPEAERVIRGPKEGFIESIEVNYTLIRRKIRNPDLKFRFKEVGNRTKTRVCICYIEGLASEKIVKELNKRIEGIDIDGILESGYIEELIKDSPLSPFKTIGNTERPDVVAAKLLEGRVALLVDGTPHVLTLPYIFIEYFQFNEDYYTNFYYSTINRWLKYLGFFISTSVPALYIALTTFHQEMIPTPLLLSISASREGVPFPTIVEALFMLIAFEILREGGVRLPSPVGSAISFVGAVILGQAAVEARFVSAPIVIVIALTGISNFLIPKMLGSLIIMRTIFLFLSAFLGLYGYIFGVIGLFIHLLSMRSFGIPYMLNFTSITDEDVKDTAIRAPWWLMHFRPKLIGKKDSERQSDYTVTRRR
ncbi:spore germination protein [Sporosalibacterium faouarense]|uniref:spore germination protein n=1 Tax=Sporosalibacterium faouarense TaxID=516123 RepID=UPI00141D2161|nr:spore germination protein [Sporosalibacterium faouarense]MTI46348.1 spore germination protein [Bacillota bacterium]